MERAPASATFRFYAGLNAHLPPGARGKSIEKAFFVPSTLKDMVESFGVPHTEVHLLIANGEPVPFSHLPRRGDRVAVYPAFRNLDLRGLDLLQPANPEPRFVLDVHLGKLAAYLRMLGFDTFYRNCYSDAAHPAEPGPGPVETRECQFGLLASGDGQPPSG